VAQCERGLAVRCADFDPDDGLVCTVGKLSVWPGASNVIAGSANFTVCPPLHPLSVRTLCRTLPGIGNLYSGPTDRVVRSVGSVCCEGFRADLDCYRRRPAAYVGGHQVSTRPTACDGSGQRDCGGGSSLSKTRTRMRRRAEGVLQHNVTLRAPDAFAFMGLSGLRPFSCRGIILL